MRQNNNQQQISDGHEAFKPKDIQQSSMSQKVFELNVQLHNSERHYQCAKIPIKCFSKFKSSLQGAKTSQKTLQFGILSQKILAPNPIESHSKNDKPNKCQKVRLKNVFEAYKQALQQKYKKRMRSFERQILKISNTKIQKNNQQIGHQLIYNRQGDTKKRLSHKKIDQSIISNLQTISTESKQPSIIRTLNHKKNTSFLLETMEETSQVFLNSLQRKTKEKKFPAQYYDYLLSPKNQEEFCRVKKRCSTELRESENEQDRYLSFNKTRNVSFKLPTKNVKTKKSLIEKLGGITDNLPQVTNKSNDHDSNTAISYLVKSLKKPSKSLTSKCEEQFIFRIQQQNMRKASNSLPKNHSNALHIRNYTHQVIKSTQQQIPLLYQDTTKQANFTLSNYFTSSQQQNNPHKLQSKDTYNNRSQIKRTKRNLSTLNEIKGWNIDTEKYQVENNVFGVG